MMTQAVTSHNLANVNTPGFRAEFTAFRSQPVVGPGYPSRAYAVLGDAGADLSAGTIQQTGRDLDVAVHGEGWIAVQGPNGKEAYTRAGDLRLSSNGLLTTGSGHPVLGDAGPIALPPAETLEIGPDGTISVQSRGQGAESLAVIGRIKLVKLPPDAVEKGADGLMRLQGGAAAPADGSVRLEVGALENSNVNAVDAMVNLIERSREFELYVKLMKIAEVNDRESTRLLSIS
jgi:flagellar basal-body rod protein FlgF